MSTGKRKRSFKAIKYRYVLGTAFALFLGLLMVHWSYSYEETPVNFFHIYVNNVEVGVLDTDETAESLLLDARRAVSSKDGLTFLETDLRVEGEAVLYGLTDSPDRVQTNMEAVLEDAKLNSLQSSYTVKINEYMVHLPNREAVTTLLQAAIDKYDTSGCFKVSLTEDTNREFHVMTVQVEDTKEHDAAGTQTVVLGKDAVPKGGAALYFGNGTDYLNYNREYQYEDYDTPVLLSMEFSQNVEVAESYLPASGIDSLEDAIAYVTKEEDKPSEYEIKSGDTLSEISINLNVPMDTLVELNSDLLDNESSTIHVGDILTYMVPEPEISVERVVRAHVDEVYDADIIYIDRDDWYTTQTNVIQQPSAGFRMTVVDIYYENDREVARDILREDVLMDAVPKIMERGTKIPPTYVKPISGGRLSSGFGNRKQPKPGASTYHKGIDWAVPQGTAVYASCGGTVSKAGTGSGYGKVIYIDHPDGRQTRYGHLSKILVTVGQTVKQGEKIALSGNTGVSTGPHLHFEILINGKQVNPLNYLN